jgi:6-phosphogluconolactonase (cycloisomerase 2 family)
MRALPIVVVSLACAAALAVSPALASADVLQLVDVQQQNQDGVQGLTGVLALAVSPDGANLYGAGESEGALAVFRRETGTGALTQLEVQRDGVGGVTGIARVSDVAVSPDGATVYTASTTDDAVAVFQRNTATGKLLWLEMQKESVAGVTGLDFARAVVVSPDGHNVYAAGQRAGSVVVFKRNGLTGTLTYAQTLTDGVDGVDGLGGVDALAVSPDGKHLYAAGMADNAVAVFRRGSEGKLTFVETLRDEKDDPQFGIVGTSGLAVSPDGKQVYVTGQGDDALAVFSRNASTGHLKLVNIYAQGVDEVEGLYGAMAVKVSPDGKRVYTTGMNDGAVSAFDRDAATGALTFLESHKNMTGPHTCLAFARAIAVSPDSQQVYVAGASSSAVNVFRVNE